MGWFDEQIRARQFTDEELFEESFLKIAGAVMGKRLSTALNDKRRQTKNAVDDILKYFGVKSREIPERMKDQNEVLEFLLRPSGIMRRTVYLEPGWARDAVGPMLGTLKEDGSVVAMIPGGFSGYTFIDPGSGERVRVTGAQEQRIDREAIAFYKPFPVKVSGIRGLLKYLGENLRFSDMALFVAASLAVTLVGLFLPYINKLLFSDVAASGSSLMLTGLAVFLICASISRLLFDTIRQFLMIRISGRLSVTVESAAMMRLLSLPADFFKKYSSGELSNRMQYISLLVNQLLDVGLSTGLTSLFSLIYIAQIFSFAPALTAPALVITITTVVISAVSTLMQMRLSRERMELASKESGMGYALITGIQKIRLAGAEKRAFARWGNLYAEIAEYLYNPPLFIKVSTSITTAVTLIGTLVMYYTAVKSGVTVAEYYAFSSAYGMVNVAFTALAGIVASVAQIKPILEMARPILETEPEVAEEKQVVERLSGAIELSHVTFRYNESMPPVLDDLSLKIRPGQYVAIVGRTGCGKSTLLRIMLGFETPQRGAVYYDGKDLNTVDLKSLRKRIGVVMQNGKLFSGDLYSNIVISAPELTLDDAWEAAELAGMGDDIRDMPMGMFTIVSEGQGGISGGQKQRLMIARAVAPKPKVLMFDEATSALDNLTQKRVSESLDSLKCTRIVIAHRLSTIRQCDRIIVLDQGRIIEDGNYEELIRGGGFFAELVARQRLDEEEFVGTTTTY